MSDDLRYAPASDFLCSAIRKEITFAGGEFGELNLKRLIEFTSDADESNRDWAALLLAQLELDRPDVVAALLAAAEDENPYVRGEAIVGLAQLKNENALALVRRELQNEWVQLQLFEAAEILADCRLIPDLERFQQTSDDPGLDEMARAALQACIAKGK